MIDLVGLLSGELKSYKIIINLSKMNEYDFCGNIYSIYDKKSLLSYIESNNNINKYFTYGMTCDKLDFINFSIKKEYLYLTLESNYKSSSLIEKPNKINKIIYDYSSPNLAKDMHIGHLRSTIIGDCLANISEYIGDDVKRINHIGDFGLPFGILVNYIMENNIVVDEKINLQEIYVKSKKEFDDKTNESFINNSYKMTSELQKIEDNDIKKTWMKIYELSKKTYDNIYKLLNVNKKLEYKGESFYGQYIDEVKDILIKKNKIELDDVGRQIIKTQYNVPLIYTKSTEKCDSFTYDTTDIVGLWYRTQIESVDEIYYVVDEGQSLHFKQLFDLATEMNWLIPNEKMAHHIEFGIILGKDGKRIKSRNGDTPKLLDLINESIGETTKKYLEKNKDKELSTLSEHDITNINTIAINSIKYYDLSKSRTTSYKFNIDEMLKFDGNTYTYMIYSLARCNGIIRKVGSDYEIKKILIDELNEHDLFLLRKISYFPTFINKVLQTLMPHFLCDYMKILVTAFHDHYTKTKTINVNPETKIVEINNSRFILCTLVKNILETIFNLLGLQCDDNFIL